MKKTIKYIGLTAISLTAIGVVIRAVSKYIGVINIKRIENREKSPKYDRLGNRL